MDLTPNTFWLFLLICHSYKEFIFEVINLRLLIYSSQTVQKIVVYF